MSVVEVIDNFLPSYHFKVLQSVMMGPDFEWYYNSQIIDKDKDNSTYNSNDYQFIHGFYSSPLISPSKGKDIKSDSFFLLDLILQKLDVKKLYRIKANLNPRTLFNVKTGYHVDESELDPHKTAVYYINTNNGGTQFKKGKKIKSLANTMVIFDSHLLHAGITCTDDKRRVVINFNYI